MVWERAFRLMGNECAYNVLCDENIYLFGETKDDDGKCRFFISCLDSDGNPIWTRQYGNYPGIMAGGIINIDDGCIFSGNVKIDNAWHALICRVDTEGDVEWEKKMPGNFIFQMHELEDDFLLAGEKSGNIWLTKLDNSGTLVWESTFDKGTGNSLLLIGDNILLAGDNGQGKPILFHIDKHGKLIQNITLERNGWIEAMAESKGKMLLARLESEPKEFTELIIMDL
jgi:outer membrane protein assembly factor BamB